MSHTKISFKKALNGLIHLSSVRTVSKLKISLRIKFLFHFMSVIEPKIDILQPTVKCKTGITAVFQSSSFCRQSGSPLFWYLKVMLSPRLNLHSCTLESGRKEKIERMNLQKQTRTNGQYFRLSTDFYAPQYPQSSFSVNVVPNLLKTVQITNLQAHNQYPAVSTLDRLFIPALTVKKWRQNLLSQKYR